MITLIISGSLITLPKTTANADVISDIECFPAVLLLRGSGEDQIMPNTGNKNVNFPSSSSDNNALFNTNGFEGNRLNLLLDSFSKKANSSSAISKLRFIGVDYPALAVFPSLSTPPDTTGMDLEQAEIVNNAWMTQNVGAALIHHLSYAQSIDSGAAEVKSIIDADEARGCDTQYLLVGYSQGALAAREAIRITNNPDKIIGSYVIGDPYQKGGASDIDKNQRSIASTGWDKNSSLRAIISYTDEHSLNPLKFFNIGLRERISLKLISDKIDDILSYPDSTIYRSDSTMTSRSLCHKLDVVCWQLGYSIAAHTNYFDSDQYDGALDLEEEVPAFNEQLIKLANSQKSNPRERSLTQTLSLKGESTRYFVANDRPDDLCSWDAGSDGIFEKNEVKCDSYKMNNSGSTMKMTVKVKDSFGIIHTYSSEEPVLDTEVLSKLVDIPRDKWLRFEAYDTDKCLTFPQVYSEIIEAGAYGQELVTDQCKQSPSSNYTFDATQVFKRSLADDKSGDYYASGYDDDYYIEATNDFSGGEVEVRSLLGLNNDTNMNPTFSGMKPVIARVINGVNYYQLQSYWGSYKGCFSSDLDLTSSYTLLPCDWSDNSQLFRPVLADKNEEYGALSVERDITPPSSPTNLKLDYPSGSQIKLSWDSSVDDRTDQVGSYVLEYYDSAYDQWERDWDFTFSTTGESNSYQTTSSWSITKYRIRAVDYSENKSDWTEIATDPTLDQ